MSPLETHLRQFNIMNIAAVADHTAYFSELCARENALFERAQANKPETPTLQLLLGLFTKIHIESLSSLQAHSEQIHSMQQSFEQQLGKQGAQVFKLPMLDELQLVTHAWLYIQGCLGMDYSLANDHAQQTSSLLSKFTNGDMDHYRVAFNQSYYIGFRYYEANKPPTSGWKRWFEKWFN
ncbi:hypothetical protein [Vibrio cionasavignyae]|uniref:hypothetical protein n=1 Tax=Vibrio cionasavignyae TaxID=2910252 RepID=UPI003D12A9BE